jgi:hypothetical protein
MHRAFFAAAAALTALTVMLGISCSRSILLTPKNQAGTRSVVLPGTVSATAAALPAAAAAAADDAAWTALEAGALPAAAGGAGGAGAATAKPAAAEPAPKRPAPEKIDLEIREKMFIAQTNDVYLNPEDYLGKTIRLEGLFKLEQYVGEDKHYCFVLRYGPGCCGNDGSAGFEVSWGRPWASAGPGPSYPAVDAWVEAVGSLETYEEDGYPYIYLNLYSLTEKEVRGAEFVKQ